MDNILLAIILIVLFVLLGPLVTIWALNTIFPVLNIPYSFDTYCAIVILGVFFRANVTVKK
jgi:hypothetical protein